MILAKLSGSHFQMGQGPSDQSGRVKQGGAEKCVRKEQVLSILQHMQTESTLTYLLTLFLSPFLTSCIVIVFSNFIWNILFLSCDIKLTNKKLNGSDVAV